jgi:hypothetical protein
MPDGGARTLRDLIDEKRDRVEIACVKCPRVGSYGLAGLLVRYGMTKRLADLLAELSADCPLRKARGLNRCGAVYRRSGDDVS